VNWVSILSMSVEVSEVIHRVQGAILLLSKEDRGPPGDCNGQMKPFASMSSREFMKETKLCAREQIDVAMEGSGHFSM